MFRVLQLVLLVFLITARVDLSFSKETTSSSNILTRFTRQAVDEELFSRCSVLFQAHACSTGLTQMAVDASTQCKQYSEAYRLFLGCTRQENGDFCDLQVGGSAIQLALVACQNNLSPNAECSDECENALSHLSSFGCCINSIYNVSIELLNLGFLQSQENVAPLFQNNLFARCGQNELRMCKNDVDIQVRSIDQLCSDATLRQNVLFTDVFCNPDSLLPTLNSLRIEAEDCYNFGLEVHKRECQQRSDGTFCISQFSNPLLDTVSEQCSIARTRSECICTTSCRDSLLAFRDEFECCVNYFNSTVSQRASLVTDGELWECCDIDRVSEMCSSTISSAGPKEVLLLHKATLLTLLVITLISF